MSVDNRIIEALSGLAPVDRDEPEDWSGPGFTFNYDTAPMAFGNNAPGYERYLVQVHLFCPVNYHCLKLKQDAKRALFKAKFTWPDEYNGGLDKESPGDVTLQHYIFECECTERVKLDG